MFFFSSINKAFVHFSNIIHPVLHQIRLVHNKGKKGSNTKALKRVGIYI